MALLSNGLLPGSFRGVPFAILGSGIVGGRRIAEHVYPGRDEPYAEDMGRAPRRFRLQGFIVENDLVYLGGPVALQRALLTAAFEKSGAGTLTHPTYGVISASVKSFSISEELDAGRRSLVEVEFVESGKRTFPTILSSSTGLLTAANLCKLALAVDGVRLVAAAVSAGGSRADVQSSASAWSAETVALGSDATALHRLAAQLPGEFGRFAGGANVGLSGQAATTYTTETTIADLVAIASADRVAIGAAAATIDATIVATDLSNPADVAAAITALVQALADACADPADAIRLLEQLIAFSPPGGEDDVTAAVSEMFQRAAGAALVTAVGDYQPSSADDANALMATVAGLLDDIATEAADNGDDATYKALRAARVAIVKDLRARGGSLAQIATFEIGRPLPVVVLAQRLYRDPTRADQLLGQVACIHPLFMPTNFQALAA